MRKNGVNGSKEKVLKGVQDMKSRNVVELMRLLSNFLKREKESVKCLRTMKII